MIYRLYLYSTTAEKRQSAAITYANAAIRAVFEKRKLTGRKPMPCMKPFDVDCVIDLIRSELKDPISGTCLCHPIGLSCEEGHYISAATSYELANKVLPKLYTIAEEHDLVLYDGETGRTFYRELIDRAHVALKMRERELKRAILQSMKPVWKFRCIESFRDDHGTGCSSVVTVRRVPQKTFAERNESFYACLKTNLREEEKLICENQCYKVEGNGYILTYVLEGYKKHCHLIGFVEKDQPKTDLLHRMGVDEAVRWMENCTGQEKTDILDRMHFFEMQDKYPNPAQRFVESVRITKWQRKQSFGIRYSGHGAYGSEVLFCVKQRHYGLEENYSVLKIEEESAGFILPFVKDVYPYIYERYYLAPNDLPFQMWVKIMDKIREAKELVLHDTFNPKLEPYIRDFNLFVLADRGTDWDQIEAVGETQFLYENRDKVAYLYDVFLKWSQAQIKAHGYDSEMMFSIQGP